MKKIRLENINSHLKEELRDKEFEKTFEIERAKVVLAQKIAEIRQEKHLRQSDIAKKLNVSQQFISQIETAQENNLTLDTLLKIAVCLGRSIKISFPKISRGTAHLSIS